jgi:hypothetical protein
MNIPLATVLGVTTIAFLKNKGSGSRNETIKRVPQFIYLVHPWFDLEGVDQKVHELYDESELEEVDLSADPELHLLGENPEWKTIPNSDLFTFLSFLENNSITYQVNDYLKSRTYNIFGDSYRIKTSISMIGKEENMLERIALAIQPEISFMKTNSIEPIPLNKIKDTYEEVLTIVKEATSIVLSKMLANLPSHLQPSSSDIALELYAEGRYKKNNVYVKSALEEDWMKEYYEEMIRERYSKKRHDIDHDIELSNPMMNIKLTAVWVNEDGKIVNFDQNVFEDAFEKIERMNLRVK